MEFRRILITGGAGFVGSNLSVALKEAFPSVAVTAFDNLKRRGSELNLARLRQRDSHDDDRSLIGCTVSLVLSLICPRSRANPGDKF